MPIKPLDALDTLDKAVAIISTNRSGHQQLSACVQAISNHIQQAAQLSKEILSLADQVQQQARQIESLKTQLRMALELLSSDQGQSESVDAEFVA